MTYKEYIENGIQLINFVLNSGNYLYNTDDYNNREWRINSTKWEDDFIAAIFINNNNWKNIGTINIYNIYQHVKDDVIVIYPSTARSWIDFGILSWDIFIPVNIKISNWKTADNLFWIQVLNYLLFWDYIMDENGIHYPKTKNENVIAEDLAFSLSNDNFNNNFNTNSIRDYFFLTINKLTWENKIYPFFNLLEDDIKVNPKNAFQVNFNNINYNISNDLDFNNNIYKLINKYYDYIEKKAQPYLILKEALGK